MELPKGYQIDKIENNGLKVTIEITKTEPFENIVKILARIIEDERIDKGIRNGYLSDLAQEFNLEIVKKGRIQMNLNETIEMMNSSDFKERTKAEYYQLKIRKEKLEDMLEKYRNGTLEFTPNCSYDLLHTQLVYMECYMNVLEERAKVENIEL